MTQDNPASNQTLHKRLSSYYLACLGRSARPEAKFFAKNKYSPEFAELQKSPFLNSVNLTSEGDARRVIELSRSKKDKQLFVGQIVFADYLESKSSDWKGFILYPLFITPIETTAGSIDCTDSPIFLNPEALKKILGISSSSELQEAALEIEEELGLGGIDGKVQSMEDVLKTVKSKFDYWNWIEEISLVQDDEESKVEDNQAKLSEVSKVGLYNRSVVFLSERPKYTLGLETELKSLGNLSPEEIKGSALAHWLGLETSLAVPETEVGLIEPIPLNSEQRDAVSRALSQPLTVITGPPGTGKSQVVSSILINAAMQGTTVLFSSKNNKAVDVVETRVNSLGQRPILLRLGARDLQERLSDYLTRIISMKTEPDDLKTYERAKQEYADLSLNLSSLSKQIKEVIQQRNAIDDLDKEIEPVRKVLGEELVAAVEELDIDLLRSSLTRFQSAVRKCTPGNQGFIGNIFPSLGKKTRQQEFTSAITNIREVFQPLGMKISSNSSFEDEDWSTLLRVLGEFMNGLDKVSEYMLNLSRLKSEDDLGVLAGRVSQLQTQTAEKSMSLWQAWLRTIPERLTQVDRRDLTKFQSTVTMLSKTVDGKSAASLKSEQQRLFPSVSRFLPCWAVTSLSVRNRVPFSPGFFDLVVIDEASQCDIASALPLLMRAKRAVIIGDPLQLRHVSNIDTSTDRMLLDQNSLMEELEWSYSSQSLFDLAAAIREEDSMITLRDHHRSDSQIIEYSNSQFYDGQLRVATKHENLIKPTTNAPAIRWIEVKGTSVRPSQGSVTCSQEAKKVVDEIERLASQGYKGSIGVVTPFAPQARLIGDLLAQRDDLTSFLRSADNLVATAHSFQGDERDVIIMSPALQAGAPESAIKFVAGQANLFNVAVTRARAALIVVGNSDAKELNKVPHIQAFVKYVDRLGKSAAKKAADSDQKDFGPTYPIDRKDGYVSDFEVTLYEALYRHGIKTVPQYSVDQYRLDLALFHKDGRLDIEVDGEFYHRHWSGENVRRDILRSQRLIELGWDVQRFWAYQVRDDLDSCVSRVKTWIEKVQRG